MSKKFRKLYKNTEAGIWLGGKVLPMFGNWNPERIVIIEFETEEQVRNCFNSTEYLKVSPFRENSTITKSVIVNGYLPSE